MIRTPCPLLVRLGALLLLCLLPALPLGAAVTGEAADSGPLTQNAAADPVADSQKGGVTNLPLPRFVSLRADEVNLRTGPGIRYPIDWVYQRRGLPVEIIDEFEAWRRIRDRHGTSGWVHQSMLSAERTAVVTGERRALLAESAPDAPVVAWLEPGVIVKLERCAGAWCLAAAEDADQHRFRGWLEKDHFWGAYADEELR